MSGHASSQITSALYMRPWRVNDSMLGVLARGIRNNDVPAGGCLVGAGLGIIWTGTQPWEVDDDNVQSTIYQYYITGAS